MTPAHKELLQEFQDFAKIAPTAHSFMERMARRLHQKMTRYNWTGFYLIDPADSNFLIVGPYAGSFTPNARIPLDTGLCGAAATTGKVIVVQDVSADPRYLAGSSLVKSEIVVPIFFSKKTGRRTRHRKLLRQHLHTTRTTFIESCASVLATYFAQSH